MRTQVPVPAEESAEQNEQSAFAAQVAHVLKVAQTSTTGHDETENLLAENGAVHVVLNGTQKPLAPDAPQNWQRGFFAHVLQDDVSAEHSLLALTLHSSGMGLKSE